MIGARRKPMPWEEEGQLGRVDQAMPSELLPYPNDPPPPPLPPMADPNVLAPAPPKRPDALSRAESASRNNRFIAALANFGASMLGGGSEAVSLEQAGKGPIDAYQRRQTETQQKQQQALAALAGRRKEAEEQRKVAAAGRDEARLGIAQEKAGREGAEYATGLEEKVAARDPNSPKNAAARERFAAMWPKEWAELPEGVRNGLTLEDMNSKEFQEFYTRGEKRYRAGLAGGLRMGAPGEPGGGGGAGRTLPSDVVAGQEEALRLQFPIPDRVPPHAEATIQQYRNARGEKERDNFRLSIEKAAAAEHKRYDKGIQAYSSELSKAQLSKVWGAYNSIIKLAKDEIRDNENIQGVGADNWLSEVFGGGSGAQMLFLSEKGRANKRRITKLTDQLLRAATGAAAPYHEHETYKNILGANMWNTDRDFVDGLRAVLETMQETERAAQKTAINAGAPDDVFEYRAQKSGVNPWMQSFESLVGKQGGRRGAAPRPGWKAMP